MRIYIGLIIFFLPFAAVSGLADWGELPRQHPRIKMETKFGNDFWLVQGVQIDPEKYNGENIRSISEKIGKPEVYEDQHHKFICVKNKETYLHVYDSGWGPGYSLAKKPMTKERQCKEIEQEIILGSGLFLGMKKSEVEKKLAKQLPDKVTDARFEEILASDTCKSGIWHAVDLKITFENRIVTGIYFDDHGEPYGSCE